jgi:hypothetical protein
MDTLLIYFRNDIRLTWRDSATRIFLFLPLVFLALLHVALPALLAAYPVVQPYGPHLLNGIVLQGGLMFSFVAGFLLLDEKDAQVLSVYQVSPLSLYQLLFRRMAFPFAMTFLYALIALARNPVHNFTGLPLLVTALLYGLVTPLGGLLVGALGRNKVEGMAWFKGVDMLLIAPILGFFLPGAWGQVFWAFPTNGVFAAGLAECAGDLGGFLVGAAVALLYIGLVLLGSVWLFVRRI